MSRTVEEIIVAGRSREEVRDEVINWMNDSKIKVKEETPDFIKGRWGTGLLTAPKYFEISFKEDPEGVKVHTEGYMSWYWVAEQSFSSKAIGGAVPRREGWKAMEKLWERLRAMSG